jgi:hypothetical protein
MALVICGERMRIDWCRGLHPAVIRRLRFDLWRRLRADCSCGGGLWRRWLVVVLARLWRRGFRRARG